LCPNLNKLALSDYQAKIKVYEYNAEDKIIRILMNITTQEGM
jgi:hypothetical protein